MKQAAFLFVLFAVVYPLHVQAITPAAKGWAFPTAEEVTPSTGEITSSSVNPDTIDGEQADTPGAFKVGLALSGGGAAGLAHIGVLKVLEEEGIPVDIVTGTSMGAIVGGLYAIGYTPDLMMEVVRSTDWRSLFEEPVLRRHIPMEEKDYDGRFLISLPVDGRRVILPTGLVSGNHIFNLLARLTWQYHDVEDFTQLPRPFVCIATDLETGEQVVLDQGFLPDAIRASMSIPSIFDPVWLDGRFLVDGGVINNMPVEEAFQLGADFVIAINSSSALKPAQELTSLPDILTQTIAIGMRTSMLQQHEHADFHIQPDLSLYSKLSFGEIDEIIKEGERAARARIDDIRVLADSLENLRGSSIPPSIPAYELLEKLQIRNLYLTGTGTIPEDHILTKLQIEPNSTIREDDLSEAFMRLYGMQRFSRISYRLDWNDEKDQADLTILLEEQTANSIHAGIFHNNTLGPSLLFNATFRNLLFPASTARFNARVGYETGVEVDYFSYIGLEPRLSFHGSAGFREREIDIFENQRRQANLRTDILFLEGRTGPLYASVVRLGFGYRFERFNLTETYGTLDVPVDWNNLHMFTGELEFDNLDRSHIPTDGQQFRLRTELSPEFLPGDVPFGKISGHWSAYLPLSNVLTLISSIHGGHIFGGTPPLHYHINSGGDRFFWGYPKDALSGNNLLTARLSGQYRFYGNFYLTAGMNIGDVYRRMDFTIFESFPRWGWGTTLSWNTAFGPLKATLSGSNRHPILLEFQIGLDL